MALFKFPGVAFITGAGGTGIGAAVAKGFARLGCHRIAITDVNKDSLHRTERAILEINPEAHIIASDGDISDEKFVTHLGKTISSKFSRLDYAVNCAGILGNSRRSTEMDIEEFDLINRVNYRGAWLSSRMALSQMLNQEPLSPSAGAASRGQAKGTIVHIASQLGIVARPTAPAYCASKAAIINMTRSDAIDYSRDGIRINCVCPGVIETPMTVGSPEVIERLRPAIDIAPMKRMGTPEEVADAALFLSSPQASFIQGHALVVDGGYTIN